jgi:hypothetical protein
MLFLSFSSDETSFYTVLLPHAPCTLANCYRMHAYIYRLIQYTCIQDDTYTHRYASTIIYLHIGWYSYILIHILAFKIHFVFAFFADYTLIHIFKPIHTHYTLRYASTTSIYLYADTDTVSHWYIYLALKIHLVFAFFAVFMGLILIHWYIYSSHYIHIIHKDTPV